MSKNQDKKKLSSTKQKKSTWTIMNVSLKKSYWISIAAILALWPCTFLLLFFDDGKHVGDIGKFGDMFGAINALFSGCAFIGIIISIRMQSEELELQRKELKETREEFKNQNFQTTFFNLFRTQREIINEFSLKLFSINSTGVVNAREIKGRALFRELKQELRKISEALNVETYRKFDQQSLDYHIFMYGDISTQDQQEEYDNFIKKENKYYTLHHYDIDEAKFNKFKELGDDQIIEKLKFIYERFFRKNEYAIGHYFRHFYHLLRFLDKSEKEYTNGIADEEETQGKNDEVSKEFLEYAEFIKAQVDTPELVLLFYNSMNYDKAKNLLIKYQIFDVLYVGNLINVEHDVIPEYNLKK